MPRITRRSCRRRSQYIVSCYRGGGAAQLNVRPDTMRYVPLLAIFATSLALANTPGDFVGKDANGLTFSIVMDSADTDITDEYETWKPRYISHYGIKKGIKKGARLALKA